MKLETTRFGTVEVDSDSVITFTQPIIGFQEFRRFILLPGPPESSVKWLQSVDSMDLAFILMDPRSVIADYAVALRKTELDELAVTKSDELDVYTLVVVPADHSQLRTNLKAPVVINMKQRLGKQTILDGSDYPIQFFLSQGQGDSDKTQEVSSARSDA